VAAVEGVGRRLLALLPHLNERQVRLAAAAEAQALGYGGVSAVAAATGIARGTIHRGLDELNTPPVTLAYEEVRVPGGGRTRLAVQYPGLVKRLKTLVESSTRGDPMSPLLWTCQSTQQLATVLSRQKPRISPDTVGRLLAEMGYSLQACSRATRSSRSTPKRRS
jgi:stage V sporulation protein SpoVS